LIPGKNVVVIGSELPWAEIFLLREGAKRVTMVDYRLPTVKEMHPQIEMLTFKEFSQRAGRGQICCF